MIIKYNIFLRAKELGFKMDIKDLTINELNLFYEISKSSEGAKDGEPNRYSDKHS